MEFGSDDHLTLASTPSWNRTDPPEVSVVVTLHNYAHLVGETLTSIVESAAVDLELVIVDDH